MRPLIALLILAALTACGDDVADQAAEDTSVLRSEVAMIDPPDEDGYLDGLRRREPERSVAFDEGELLELGEIACNLTRGYVGGTRPTPGEEFTEVIVERGHAREVAERMAGAVRNAARGALCDVEVVEGP